MTTKRQRKKKKEMFDFTFFFLDERNVFDKKTLKEGFFSF